MITEDDVVALFARADPARSGDGVVPADASEYLDTLLAQELIPATIDGRLPLARARGHRRWVLAAAVVAVAFLGTALVVARREHSVDHVPMAPSTRLPVPEDVDRVARGFLDAVGRWDAEGALSYLTPGAAPVFTERDAVTTMEPGGSPAEFRLVVAHLAAIGFQQRVEPCTVRRREGATTHVRCPFAFHALGSDRIGLGPYAGASWELAVRDGKVVAASNRWAVGNGFATEMWEPFGAWIHAEHPGDEPLMYIDESQERPFVDERAAQRWRERTDEYASAGAAYNQRVASICAAAATERPSPGSGTGADLAALARWAERSLAEVRALPPPVAVRAVFEQGTAILERDVERLRTDSPAGPPEAALLHPSLRGCRAVR